MPQILAPLYPSMLRISIYHEALRALAFEIIFSDNWNKDATFSVRLQKGKIYLFLHERHKDNV